MDAFNTKSAFRYIGLAGQVYRKGSLDFAFRIEEGK